jgi:hypothetical protein
MTFAPIKFLSVFFVCLSVFSCDRHQTDPEGEVEFYLLENFETVEEGWGCAIDQSTVELASVPLIRYDDLTSYDPAEYTFCITEKAAEAIDALEHSVSGLAFAVTANGEMVYTGYFWPAYSSLACDWITIDPISIDMQAAMEAEPLEMKVELGYPGTMEGQEITDRRNDSRILAIFRRDGKLVE